MYVAKHVKGFIVNGGKNYSALMPKANTQGEEDYVEPQHLFMQDPLKEDYVLKDHIPISNQRTP
jgi:hypothetical protein